MAVRSAGAASSCASACSGSGSTPRYAARILSTAGGLASGSSSSHFSHCAMRLRTFQVIQGPVPVDMALTPVHAHRASWRSASPLLAESFNLVPTELQRDVRVAGAQNVRDLKPYVVLAKVLALCGGFRGSAVDIRPWSAALEMQEGTLTRGFGLRGRDSNSQPTD